MDFNEEGKKFIDKWLEKQSFRNRWIQRISNYKFDIEKLIEFDKRKSDILYKKGIDGQSNLIWLIYYALKSLSLPLEEYDYRIFTVDDYGMFTVDGFIYNGYKFEVISGRGRFVIIEKN